MARPTLTRTQRAAAVQAAAASIADLMRDALAAERSGNLAAAQQAWDRVETAGATIHRQSRLLSGKNRGG